MNQVLSSGFLLLTLASQAYAQDITGTWQGTLNVGRNLRTIVRLERNDSGGWSGTLSSIDQSPDWGIGAPITSVALSGTDLKFTVPGLNGTYEGKLTSDGAITGIWTQERSWPLELRRPTKQTEWLDPSPHSIQFENAEKDVALEVLDWGGSGRTLVLLAGLGNTAHIFDKFAPKLATDYHVYGITRRGFGSSSVPESGYSADRLGDDVLAVMNSLKLDRPVLVGHSIAGQELSSIATRHREKISGLIYLDAAYAYAYYDESVGDLRIDSLELQRKLVQLREQPNGLKEQVQDLLQNVLPRFQKDLMETTKDLEVMPSQDAGPARIPPLPMVAMQSGLQKFTDIRVPVLAIYASPQDVRPAFRNNPAGLPAAEARLRDHTEAQAKAFENGVPSARVVRLPRASHYLFASNEADVLKEIRDFVDGLR